MKKSKNILKLLILIIIILFTTFTSHSEASFWSDIFKYGDDFLEQGATEAANIATNPEDPNVGATDENTRQLMNDIYSVLFPLGVAITVIVGGILGIKFMLASAEDKAKVKQSMVPYVIGCIVIYGSFGIWRICIQIFSTLG